MLKFLKGDLLKANADALVNTVNTVGVMGKGIALQFKEAFPQNNKVYVDACKKQVFSTGQVLAVWDSNLLLGKKLIINFPTKKHWRHPSRYEYIETGLRALADLLKREQIKSVALPPLGCGNGGLEWIRVKELISNYLGDVETEVLVYEPNAEIKALLQKENSITDVKLTPARAQLLFALFVYESFGENSSLFSANKLAYFLQRMGQPLKLRFERNSYGPFAIGVGKVLYMLNGVYLKGMEQQEVKPFEPLELNYEKWEEVRDYVNKHLDAQEMRRLMGLVHFVSGFTSELSLEILSTVSFILDEYPQFTLEQVKKEVKTWSKRKAQLFKDDYLETAYQHLINYRNLNN